MQWLRSAFQLSTFMSQSYRSPILGFARPASSIRRLVSQTTASSKPRLLVKPLKHATLEASAGTFFVPGKSDPFHSCPDFIMILKPYPRHLVDNKGCVVETRLLPHWLPMPPHPSTHQRRHLTLPMPSTSSSPPIETVDAEERDDEDRWEPLSHAREVASADVIRPILRVFVMATKKRIHKRAVIRHRVRTRLIAALRTASFRLQEAEVDVERKLDLRRNVLMLVAHPTAYSKGMDELVVEMDKGLRRVARLPSTVSSTSSNPRKHDSKRESNKAASIGRSQPRKV